MVKIDEEFAIHVDKLWEIAYENGKKDGYDDAYKDGYDDAYEELKMQEEVNKETATFKLNQIKELIEDLELYKSLPSSENTLSVGEITNKDDIVKYYTLDEIINFIFRVKTLLEEIGEWV